MDNIGLSLVLGISSSLLATGLFIMISEFARRVVLPWYADTIYRGVRIDGDWEIIESDGNAWERDDMTMQFSLSQRGEKVTGVYTHKNKEEIDEYILDGRIRDMYFLATAVPKSNRHVDGISFLLHIDNVKSKLIMTGAILVQGDPGKVESFEGMKFEWKNS